MPDTNYLPLREAELVDWMQNFSGKITAAPADVGLTEPQATDCADAIASFVTAYNIAIDPISRTTPTVRDKNTKKRNAIRSVRATVALCQAWPGMTDTIREQLQITVRDLEPTPIGPPEEMPKLTVFSEGALITVQVRTQDDKKRKPVGVRSVWMYTFVGETPSTDLQQWRFEGGSTKADPQFILPGLLPAGTKVWVTAQWVNPTDQAGPACAPVFTHISYDGMNAVAA
jgi:hypothetical protein